MSVLAHTVMSQKLLEVLLESEFDASQSLAVNWFKDGNGEGGGQGGFRIRGREGRHPLTPSVCTVCKYICVYAHQSDIRYGKKRRERSPGTECIEELARLRGCWWRRQKGRLCLHILHKRLHKCQPSECVWALAEKR